MFHKVIVLVLVDMLKTSLALAQTPSGSRLDEVIKSGTLRVCTPGDCKPFSFHRPDGGFERLDIDLVQAAAKAIGVKVETGTTARQKTAFLADAYMVNRKAPIT